MPLLFDKMKDSLLFSNNIGYVRVEAPLVYKLTDMISVSVYHCSSVTAIVHYSTSLIRSMDAPASHFKSMKDCLVTT